MTKCKKCGHIGKPETKRRWSGLQLTLLLLLMIPLWSASAFIILSIGVLGNFCDGGFMLLSDGCFIGTILLSIIVTLIYIVTVLYKSKQPIEICEKCGERIEEDKVGRDKDLFS